MITRFLSVFVLVGFLAAACAPAGSPGTGAPGGIVPAPPVPSRTLNSIMKVEPASLASKPLTPTGISVAHAVRLFNAQLDQQDGQERPRPYLAEALPELNTDSWQVFPDSTMRTSYRLKPNLTWHDRTPLTADDFAFAYEVYSRPDLGQSGTTPIRQMASVEAPDRQTVVINWKVLYPDAQSLGLDFQALPRHILSQPLATLDAAGVVNQPFWASEYVGAGPYQLAQWQPGAFIEGEAFDQHVLGRPKIDRVRVRFVPDETTALSQLLSGDVQFATDRTIRFQQAEELKRQWGTTGGAPILSPVQPRYQSVQLRPEVANPAALLDVRVRRALASTVDKQALSDGIFEGQGVPADSPIATRAPYWPDVERAIMRYPLDLRRAEQLLTEAGFAKGGDGYFVSGGQRLVVPLQQDTGGQVERELGILIDSWKKAGVEIQSNFMSETQLRDTQFRSSFPGLEGNASGGAVQYGERNLQNWTSAQAASPATNWRGSNYGGWSNPEYDRLWEQFNLTLERQQRNQQVVQMAALISQDLPLLMLYWNFNISAYSSAVKGVDTNAVDTLVNGNIHEWEMR
jgi:peptide/nickel transport system substrate-binding protein